MKQTDIFFRTRRNISLISMGIVFICLAIFAVITQVSYKSRLFDTVDQQLQTHKNMIIRSTSIIKQKGDQEEIIIPAPITPNLISFVWKGDELVDRSPHPYFGLEEYPVFPKEYNDGFITITTGDYSYRALRFEKQGLRIELLMNVDAEILSVKELNKALLISLCILVIIGLYLSFYLASIVLKPVRRAYEQQVFFVQDASHEMRTPLAIIKGQLEIMRCHSQDTIEKHFEELSQMMSEIRGLEKLNSDLLLLSKEDITPKLTITSFYLNEWIDEVREFYEDLSEFQNKTFRVEKLEKDTEVEWDKIKMKRCLTILLENAFKYTHEEDEISLICKTSDKEICIEVIDTGIGIKTEDRKRVFDRFFRSSEVRSKGIEGSGIGLSLLKSLASTMGVRIQLDSKEGRGTKFRLSIPLKMKEIRK